MNRLCLRPSQVFWTQMPVEQGGYEFSCDLRDMIAREVCFTGQYEPQETMLMHALLTPGMTFVDVGANWGYFTLLAAHLVGTRGRVLSLEPDPRLFPKLRDNVARNNLQQVTVLPIAAAAKPGTLLLAGYNEADGNFGLSRVVSHGSANAQTFPVEARPLDEIFDIYGVTNIDLLKMDIEGAEGFALAGLLQALSTHRIHRLLVELHPAQLAEHGHTVEDIGKQLSAMGYRAWTVDHSPTATRRAAYAKHHDIGSILLPLAPREKLDAWPHVLWCLPGSEPLSPNSTSIVRMLLLPAQGEAREQNRHLRYE